jgi:hypothetical protein
VYFNDCIVCRDVLVLVGVPTCECSLLGRNKLASQNPMLELRLSVK